MEKIPNIKTQLPGPNAKGILRDSLKYEPHSMSEQVPIVWSKGSGAVVEDVDGNIFIDFSSGVLVANVGHAHPKLAGAIKAQADELLNCYDFLHPWRIKLAQKLIDLTPPNLDKVFFVSSGSEAIEGSIKMARRYTEKFEIISFHGGFHGRTYMCMSVGGKKSVKKGFGPLVPGVLFAPFAYCYRCSFGLTFPECNYQCINYLDRVLESESTGSVAALLVETYQGAAGSIIPPEGYFPRLEKWCQDNDILLILDEVQASFCRTGKMFAFEHYNLKPNLLCLGKGIACGVPTAAIVGESRIMDVLEAGSMSSTYGGNPLSCRSALAVIEIYEEEKLAERSARIGAYLMERFKKMQKNSKYLGDVRGLGLAIGLEIVEDKKTKKPAPELTKKIVFDCYQRGLILIAPIGFYGNVIRISPPLVISEDLAVKAADIIEEVLKAL